MRIESMTVWPLRRKVPRPKAGMLMSGFPCEVVSDRGDCAAGGRFVHCAPAVEAAAQHGQAEGGDHQEGGAPAEWLERSIRMRTREKNA
ncbi:hypothetical protein D3C81_1843310 [compost metagenome]